jgi:hypothetical protein
LAKKGRPKLAQVSAAPASAASGATAESGTLASFSDVSPASVGGDGDGDEALEQALATRSIAGRIFCIQVF